MRHAILPASIVAGAVALSFAFAYLASADLQGQSVLDCAHNPNDNNKPYKDGTVCQRSNVKCEGVEINKPAPEPALTSFVPRFVAAAATLAQTGKGDVGYVTSVCKSGQCVATYGCDGNPLPGVPSVPIEELPPNTTPTPVTDPDTTPSPIQTPDLFPTSPTPSPTTPNTTPLPPNTSPTPITRPDTTPSPLPPSPWKGGGGSTFPSSPSVVAPNPGSGGFGADGVYSGGNPFINPSGTTFTGSWSGSSGASLNLFSGFLSGLGNLFSGLMGGGAPTIASPSAPTPQPSAQDQADRAESIIRRLQARQDAQAAARRAAIEEERRRMIEDALKLGATSPFQAFQSQDRTGLPAPGEKTLEDIVREMTGPRVNPMIPPSVIQGIEVPKPLPPRSENLSPEGGGNASGNVPSTPSVITREMAEAELERARDALDQRSPYDRLLDRLGVGSAETAAYRNALRALGETVKQENLKRLALEQVHTMPSGVQVAEGGPVTTDATPVGGNLEEVLSPAQRAQLEADYQAFVRRYDAAATDAEREQLVRDEIERLTTETEQRLDPDMRVKMERLGVTFPIISPTSVPAPQPAFPPSRLLQGLSAMGARAAEAARTSVASIARVFGFGASLPQPVSVPPPIVDSAFSGSDVETVPDEATLGSEPAVIPPLPVQKPSIPASTPSPAPTQPTPQPTPTPAPQPAPGPTPAPPSAPATPSPAPSARPSSGFIQGSISLLGALLNTVVSFFTGEEEETPSPTVPRNTQPAPTPTAAITANPSLVDSGARSKLSWSSVGTLGCAVVDSQLNIIARNGQSGDVTSPMLTESSRFGVICDIENGNDKYINETIVHVRGDESDPERIFAQIGRASNAAPVASSDSTGQNGGTQGTSRTEAPVDVRTCDPDQSMDTFIKCLCEAEPNPNGCSIPPGGL